MIRICELMVKGASVAAVAPMSGIRAIFNVYTVALLSIFA